MEEAYNHLQRGASLNQLPAVINESLLGVHELLGGADGGYVLQAFRCVARHLDTNFFGDHESVKRKRLTTLDRLRQLLKDGARAPFFRYPYKYTTHLLVLLWEPKDLENYLSLHVDCNVQREGSKCTPLHVAAQEGNKDMVNTLLKHGANKQVRDLCVISRLIMQG